MTRNSSSPIGKCSPMPAESYRPRRIPWLLAASMAVCTPDAHADSGLAVLGSDSAARPAESLIGNLLSRFTEPEDGSGSVSRLPGRDPGNLTAGGGLPLTSGLVPSLGDGDVIRRIGRPLAGPVCVVGTDPVSRSWLSRNRYLLHRLGASCVLVEARSRDDVDSIRQIASPVPVHPLPFDHVAAQLGIRTVPALLVGENLE